MHPHPCPLPLAGEGVDTALCKGADCLLVASSPLPQAFIAGPLYRAEQIFNHSPLAGFYFSADVHAWADGYALAVNRHVVVCQAQLAG